MKIKIPDILIAMLFALMITGLCWLTTAGHFFIITLNKHTQIKHKGV